MKIGILIHFDPTVKKINSEMLFLNALIGQLSPSSVKFISCMTTQGADRLISRFDFDFPYSVIHVKNQDMTDLDALIAWNTTNMSNFFGGCMSKVYVDFYQAVSEASNNGVPILYRSGDSENDIYDYQEVVMGRLENEKFKKTNEELIDTIKLIPRINYDKYYLLVNGERDKFDWVPDTYLQRKPMKFFTKKICDQSLYLGDDLFFQVLEKYHEMEGKTSFTHNDSLFWIGFIEHRNAGRKKVFLDLFKDITVPVTCHTDGTEFTIPGVKWINQGIIGDTVDFFNYLSGFLGYVFIGKGTPKCSYMNKTIYDCFIARLPALIYSKTDVDRMIYPDHPEFYFDDQAGLLKLYDKLLDPAYRSYVIESQAASIKQRFDKPLNIIDKKILKEVMDNGRIESVKKKNLIF